MRSNLYNRTIFQKICGILITATLYLFVGGCSKEATSSQQEPAAYSLQQARELYELNNSPATLPEWVLPATVSAKAIAPDHELIPNWKEVKTTRLPNQNLIRYEIPMTALHTLVAFTPKRRQVEVSHTLVIEFETKSAVSRQFVATLIGTQVDKALTYSSKKDKFSGIMFLSEINGRFITGFHYANRIQTVVKLRDPNSTEVALASFWIGILSQKTKLPDNSPKYKYCRECASTQPFNGNVCLTCGLWSMGLREVVVSVDKPDKETPYCSNCFYSPCRCNSPDPDAPFRCPNCLHSYCSGECGATGGGGEIPAEGEWWPIEHEAMLLQALKEHVDLTSLKQVINGSEYADKGAGHQNPENAHMHAMRSPKITKEEAINRMKDYTVEQITKFSQSHDYFALGMALHAIQDAYSPAHDFKIWDAEKLSYLPHIFESFLIYRHQGLNAQAETERIYLEIIAGDGSIERARAIFDAWLYRFFNF